MFNQHHLYCWLLTCRRWPQRARTPNFHVSHTGNSPGCPWVCFQLSPPWRCSHPGADSGVCWMPGAASGGRGSPDLLGQAVAWAESNSRQLMQETSNAGNNCSYTELYQLGGVPRVRVAVVRLSEGWHLAAWSLSLYCLSQPCALRRWLQLGGSYSPVSAGECRHPLQGASHGKCLSRRSERGQMENGLYLAWKAFLLGGSSIKVGFLPVPFPKQGSI